MKRTISLTAVCLFAPALTAQDPAVEVIEEVVDVSSTEASKHAIFDGKTLDGWTTTGGRYDGTAKWSVEDGAIVGRSGPKKTGGLIYTQQAWHSYDVSFRTKIDWPFDSGVFVRMSPAGKGAQVTLDWREGGEIGGIYSDGWLQHNPEGAGKFRRGEWNDVRVRCTGRDFRLEFWLNGEKLTDYRQPVGSEGFAATGLLGLQVHPGTESEDVAARFEQIELVELPVFALGDFECDDDGFLTARDKSGWESLLDAGLSRWETTDGRADGFACDGRTLELRMAGAAHELRTKADYQDFALRLDFKTVRRANSGIFLRADRSNGNPAFSGCEIQVLDDFHWEADTKSKLKPWQFTGSLYGSVPAGHTGALYPLGRWNTLEIRYQGSRIRTELNGVELYDVDTTELKPEQGEPFAARAKAGFLGLQRHAPAGEVVGSAYAWYRNVFVRRL